VLKLPPRDSEIRDLFTVEQLAEMTTNGNTPPTFNEARYSARQQFQACKGIRGIFMICMRADDEIWLVRFGSRGGWKRLWNFGHRLQRAA